MEPELSKKVSLGLKIVAVVPIIICIGLGSNVIDGGVNRGTLWQCAVASVVFDLVFLLLLALMIGARLKRLPPQIARMVPCFYVNINNKPWIEMAILILGTILYFSFGVLFFYYTTGTHRVGKLTINISALPGASDGHALGTFYLFTFLTMAIDVIVVFKQSYLPVATNEPEEREPEEREPEEREPEEIEMEPKPA